MPTGETTHVPESGPNPGSDAAFQELLFRISAAASQGAEATDLIRLFCREAREHFRVDGVYFWSLASADELVGMEADGLAAERFKGLRVHASQSGPAMEAIRERRAVCANQLGQSPLGEGFRVESGMAAPLIISGAVVGVAFFAHNSLADYFIPEMATKATILLGQLGSLLEARRLPKASPEEPRRTETIPQVPQAIPAVPDSNAVVEAVADRLRILLRTRLVCVLLRRGAGFGLNTVAAESAQLAAVARARHDRQGLQFAADLAARAVAAGEPVTVAIDPSGHSMGDLLPPGTLIAAPFRTSRTQGAVLVYPRAEGAYSADEKALVAAVAGFGAVAIANAELYSTARAQAHELHQLLDISVDLGSPGQLDQFMQQFAGRAADFLGFGRALVGLVKDPDTFQVHWEVSGGRIRPVDFSIPEGVIARTLREKEVFWSDDAGKVAEANWNAVLELPVQQILAVPLLRPDGKLLGMFAMLDRLDFGGISQEDIRRAKALAAQAAPVLDTVLGLYRSENARRKAESLSNLTLELNPMLQPTELAQSFVGRAAAFVGAKATALVVNGDSDFETLVLEGSADQSSQGALRRLLGQGIYAALGKSDAAVIAFGPAAPSRSLFDAELSARLGWDDGVMLRLPDASGNSMGALCLANLGRPLSADEEQVLRAGARPAAQALQNSRLFSRMDRANRHWMEIFDAITDFIVVHDEADRIMRVNRSLANFIGVAPQDLIGLNMSALLFVNQTPALRNCPFCRGTTEEVDEYVHPELGSTYLVSTSRAHGASNEGLQTIHVLKDISDRREAERRYHELFTNIQEGLFFSTPEGAFIEVNDALVRMLGYRSREELLQANASTHAFGSPEQYERFAEQMRQHGAVRNHEQTLRRQDGAPVHVLINAFAMRDPQGRILQYRGLILDISDLKSYQSELQRERDFSGKILNNTQSLILVTDGNGLISYANRRWQDMGYTQKQLLGQSLENLIAPPRRQVFKEALSALLTGQQVDNLDLQILWGDGRVGHFSVNLSPMRDEQGKVTSLVVVMSDITDAATLQAKLMHAEKMAAVGQLVSGVAHEVNNPLTAILGFADLLMENQDLPDTARKDLRVILQEAQRTKQIVQNLLSFARQMPPQRKPVDLNSILRRTVQLRSYDFQSHGVEVVEQLEQVLPYVVGDSQQLQQVFLNILNNAYDAVRETGRPARIEIQTAAREDFVEITFRDNGPGIVNPERIFDPFFTTKEVGKGTGLGLSICYGIVHEHRGEILCHNNAGSEGATFTVRLPAVAEPALRGAAAGAIPL